MMYTVYYDSPIGLIEIQSNGEKISSIHFINHEIENYPDLEKNNQDNREHPLLKQAIDQLDEYFKGNLKEFTLPLEMQGTPFQKNVWEKVQAVPYGQSSSYRDIAIHVGNEKSVRAIGHANSKNHFLIVVPCHRVVGLNGQLTGYAGGLWRKEWLLNHEKKNPCISF